jgi:hypothetical protein
VTSSDGITWRARSATEANTWRSVFYGQDKFVATSYDGTNRVMTATSLPWSLAQTGFQFRDDDGNEVAATDIGGQNSVVTSALNDPLRFRAQVQSSLATTATPYYLQYKATTELGWHTVGVDDDFPTIVATSSGRDTTGSTTHVITLPSGQIGDLLLVISSQDGSLSSLTSSTGWKELGEQSNTNIVSGAIFWKTATGGDTLTITSAVSVEASYIVYRIRNAGTPSGAVANSSGTNSNPPSHTTDKVRNYLWIASRSGDSTVVATAVQTGYYGFISQAANTTSGASSNSSHIFLRATTTDPGTFTSATEQWVSWTIAVQTNTNR